MDKLTGKRIALVGNIQNWNFALVCWLRSKGYDATLYFQPVSFFKPSTDTYTLEFLNHCIEVDWVKRGLPYDNKSKNLIISILKPYDFIIGSGMECAILNFCGINIDIYVPLGSDFYLDPFLPHNYNFLTRVYYLLNPNKKYKDISFGTLSKYMYMAISSSSNIILENSNPWYESLFEQFNYQGNRHRFTPPFLFHVDAINQFELNPYPGCHWRDYFVKLRSENNFLILYHGRHVWNNPNDINKGTDRLIIGFASFLKNVDSKNGVKLVLLDYGADVHYSKELIKELNIEEFVVWFPQMFRKELLFLISLVDLCSGEFFESYLTFGTIVEAMLMAKPVIHFRDDSLYSNQYAELYPLLNCRYPEEIAVKLTQYYIDREGLREIGLKAQNWCEKYVIKEPLDRIIEIIENK